MVLVWLKHLTHFVVFGGGHRPDEDEEEEVLIGWQEKLFSQVSHCHLSTQSTSTWSTFTGMVAGKDS